MSYDLPGEVNMLRTLAPFWPMTSRTRPVYKLTLSIR